MGPATFTNSSSFLLPDRMPMIVLEGCYHFPGCLLPLFIFEERYRLMLGHALRTDRMFCVGVDAGAGDVLPVVTAGLVHASVKNQDGTSQVLLLGMQRMRITGWEQLAPFRIARVEPVTPQDACPESLRAMKSRALELLPPLTKDSCEGMLKLRDELERMPGGEAACDIIAFHFLKKKTALRALLEECCPQRRFELLIRELEKSGG